MAKKPVREYEEEFEEVGQAADADAATGEVVEAKANGELYTYVGKGENPPRRIHFMGRQVFSRGVATPVSDPTVLAKLKGHPCFVKGEVEQDAIHDADEVAGKVADQQRQKDAKTNAKVMKIMKAWAAKGEEE